MGTTSVTLAFTFLDQESQVVGSGRTVAVAVEEKNWRKIPVPGEVRKALAE